MGSYLASPRTTLFAFSLFRFDCDARMHTKGPPPNHAPFKKSRTRENTLQIARRKFSQDILDEMVIE